MIIYYHKSDIIGQYISKENIDFEGFRDTEPNPTKINIRIHIPGNRCNYMRTIMDQYTFISIENIK